MSDDPPRVETSVPGQVDMPRLFDFYELQDAEHTGIHQFYENLRDGSLTTTKCRDCGELHFPPRIVCPECTGDDLTYTSLPHVGELYTYTEVRGTAAIGMNEDTPFVAGVVDLGPVKLSARIEGADLGDVAIGDPVELVVVDVDDDLDQQRAFYRFRPIADDQQ